jgi:hypothetical protein
MLAGLVAFCRVKRMAKPVEICTSELRILRSNKDGPMLQQKWEIVAAGETRYDWRNVPVVAADDGANSAGDSEPSAGT